MSSRGRFASVAVHDRAERFDVEDRNHPPVLLSHRRPVRLLDRRCPAPQRLALVGEVCVPGLERILLGLSLRFLYARRERPGLRRLDVAAVDQDERSGAPWETDGEGAADLCAPGEADERGAVDAELREQLSSKPGQAGRQVRIRRNRGRAAVSRRVRRDRATAVLSTRIGAISFACRPVPPRPSQ
jgi:hypothetical protein